MEASSTSKSNEYDKSSITNLYANLRSIRNEIFIVDDDIVHTRQKINQMAKNCDMLKQTLYTIELDQIKSQAVLDAEMKEFEEFKDRINVYKKEITEALKDEHNILKK